MAAIEAIESATCRGCGDEDPGGPFLQFAQVVSGLGRPDTGSAPGYV